MANGMEMAGRSTRMGACTPATGYRIKCMDMVPSLSQAEIRTPESSRMTRSTAMAFSLSQMDSSMMVSMRTIRSMGRVHTTGQTDLPTKVDGIRM